ncbi:MAG: serine/threonine-protein kinase [Actinomycetota bacterium]
MAALDLDAFTGVVPLGSGGVGDVFRATRRSTGGEVAIKVLRDWSDREVAWRRAQRELRALVDLRGHSNVVNVEEVIETDETLAIVMEFAPGGSVADLMRARGGRLEFPETLMVAEQTATALAAAHERGIIHRDIKPHNLLIGAFGNVKVCDFGIAALTRSEEFSNPTNALSLRYASPEELRGGDVGPPADVYSLAASVHQLLTGEYLPPPDGTAQSLPLRSWVAPDALPSAIVDPFRDLVVRSADRTPANRPTAAELRDQFEVLGQRLGAARCRALPLVTTSDDDDATTPAVTVRDAPSSATTVAQPSNGDPAVPSGLAAASLDLHRRNRRVAVAAFAALGVIIGLGGLALALGWFDSDGGTAASVPSSPATPVPTVSTVSPSTVAATVPPETEATPVTTATAIPERHDGPQCPGAGACIEMTNIAVRDDEFEIEWVASFSPALDDVHAHFFWDVYDASQVGSASADRAPWELTDQQPFVPEGEMQLANRPPDATGICVTAAGADHAVLDADYFHCALVGADDSTTDIQT